jgi:tetratricopeptide (TPR) repeat protein
MSLVTNTNLLAAKIELKGRAAEAERLWQRLEEDIAAISARFSGPEFHELRQSWAQQLSEAMPASDSAARRQMIRNCRLAIVLDPTNAMAYNNLAWSMVYAPEDPTFDPQEALAIARKAVKLNPTHWFLWNTLGVAAYRAGDWKTAAEWLEKSIGVNGGQAIDGFFLAMTRWRQGQKTAARQSYQQAVEWLERNSSTASNSADLRRFHTEAATLLKLPGPKPTSQAAPAQIGQSETETADQKAQRSRPQKRSVQQTARPDSLGARPRENGNLPECPSPVVDLNEQAEDQSSS